MKELVMAALKAIAGLPADVVEFFTEAQTSLFFGTMVLQIIIFLSLVIYMILRKVFRNDRRKLARTLERFPFYIWTVFFAGYVSFFYDSFIILPFVDGKLEVSPMVDTLEVAVCFVLFNIWTLSFIDKQGLETKRISQIVREIEEEKDEKKRRVRMEEYRLNEQICRKEMLLHRYRGFFLTAACALCAVACIGVAFFDIARGLILGCKLYTELGILAIMVTGAGMFFWFVAVSIIYGV